MRVTYLGNNWDNIFLGILIGILSVFIIYLLKFPLRWLLKSCIGHFLFPKIVNSQKNIFYVYDFLEHQYEYKIKIPNIFLVKLANALLLKPVCYTDLSEMRPVFFSRFSSKLNGEFIDIGPRINITSKKFNLLTLIEKSKKYDYHELCGQTVPIKITFYENMNITDLKNLDHITYIEDNSESECLSIKLKNNQNFNIHGLLVKKDFNPGDRINRVQLVKEGTPFLPFSISIDRRNLSTEEQVVKFWDDLKTGDIGISSITYYCTINLKPHETVEIKIFYTK